MGIEGVVMVCTWPWVMLLFTGAAKNSTLSINGQVRGYFSMHNRYRKGIPGLLLQLRKKYALTVLSGDNARKKNSCAS